MSSANVRRAAAAGAMLAAAFIGGFAGETMSLFDGFWPFILGVISPWLLLLTAALVAILNRNVPLVSTLRSGSALGCVMAMLFVVGWFSPFALQVGGRELADFGAEAPWSGILVLGLIVGGLAGMAVGAISAVTARALQFGLGPMRSERERDTSEAAGER